MPSTTFIVYLLVLLKAKINMNHKVRFSEP